MLLLNGALVLLASFLLTPSVAQEQPVQCFNASSPTIGLGCEDSDPSFMASTIEECCVRLSGQFYRQTSGDQSCQACIVFGWLDGPELSTEERGDATILELGFIKGALFEEFLEIDDQRGELRFTITVTAGTATQGTNFDFSVPDSSRTATIRDATVPATIQIFIRIDGRALELPEDFNLTLIGANDAADAALNAAAPNTFVVPTIRVIIEDREVAVLQFTESDYSSSEDMEVLSPSIQLLTNIATDLTVVAISVNYTSVNDSRAQSPLADAILLAIPAVPDYNPRRPVNATSFPFEDRDFSSTQVSVTFPADENAGIRQIEIEIVDDNINEVEQLFIIFLQVVTAVDPSRVDLGGRFATLGRIIDDDPLIIGFEQSSYTCREEEATGQLTLIPIIKGNNQRSELTFSLTYNVIAGSGPNAANINQVDILGLLMQRRDFEPDDQVLPFLFELVDDDEPENTEMFQVELSLDESGLNVDLGGGDLFASTQIVIIDDDATVTIGWEKLFTPVNESHGVLELCVLILNITGNVNASFPPFIMITLAANTISGTAADPGDYERLSESRSDLFFEDITATNNRSCIEVVINDDNLLEATENFSVEVVPDSFNHPTGLPPNFFLEPNLTVVEIINNDFVTIGFTETDYAVNESSLNATVTVAVRGGGIQRPVRVDFFTVIVIPSDTAVVGADFSTVIRDLVFDENTMTITVDIPIIDDDIVEDPMETFTVSLERDPLDPSDVVNISPDAATVVIQDDDRVTIGFEQTGYAAGEGTIVEICAVQTTGTLEREAVVTFSTSDGSATAPADYTATTVSFTFDSTNSRRCVNVSVQNDNILEATENFFGNLNTTDTAVLLDPDRAVVDIIDAGLTIGLEQTVYSVGEGAGSQEVCAIVIAGMLNRAAVVTLCTGDDTAEAPMDYVAITESLIFGPGTNRVCRNVDIVDDDVTEPRIECLNLTLKTNDTGIDLAPDAGKVFIEDNDGVTTVNDTVIGDPLFTVPVFVPDLESLGIGLDRISLCYELHGQSDEWFNLVTDECTSVNAHYINTASRLNVINQIAIRAADVAGNCREILVIREGCAVQLDGVPLNRSARFNDNDIKIKRYPQRVRVTVPNCDEQRLIMWITCETTSQENTPGDTITIDSIRFDVMRGLNFGHRDSHGIIGQFWNVPIQLAPFTGTLRNAQVQYPDAYTITVTRTGSPQRVFTGQLDNRIWDRSLEPCLYAGNQQAGVIYEVEEPNDRVIEGNYESYRVPSAFEETDYQFGRFDENMCL